MSTSVPPTVSSRSVFVAEDEALIALDIVSCLEYAGCEVVGPFAEVAAALEAARARRVEVAVLDVNLRGEPVWPVAELLRSQGVPIAFLTGYASLNEFPAAFADAPRLDKPFVENELLAVLSALGAPAAPRTADKRFASVPQAVHRILAGSL